MTAEIPAGAQLNWGLRHVRIFRLGADGNIAGADTSGYLTPYRFDGVHIEGATAFNVTEPTPRTFDFPGDDGIIGSDSRPALQGETAELTASPWDFELLALLENVKVVSNAGRRRMSRGTNKAGTEPRFGVMLYQQSLDLDSGATKWHTIVYASAKITALGAGAGDTPQQTRFQIVPTKTKKHLWGAERTEEEDGATTGRKTELEGFNKPFMTRLYLDGTTLTFELDDDHAIGDAETVEIWKNGALMLNGFTVSVANNNIIFDDPGTADDLVVVFYEEAPSA